MFNVRPLVGFGIVAFVIAVAIPLVSRAGDLNPPPGPIAPSMVSLEDLSVQSSALEVAVAAVQTTTAVLGVKKVLRGQASFPTDGVTSLVTVALPSSIDPAKSTVSVSAYFQTAGAPGTSVGVPATVESLSATSITIRRQLLCVTNCGGGQTSQGVVNFEIVEYR